MAKGAHCLSQQKGIIVCQSKPDILPITTKEHYTAIAKGHTTYHSKRALHSVKLPVTVNGTLGLS